MDSRDTISTIPIRTRLKGQIGIVTLVAVRRVARVQQAGGVAPAGSVVNVVIHGQIIA